MKATHTRLFSLLIFLLSAALIRPGAAEDGYDLWLRYPQASAPWLTTYQQSLTQLVAGSD